jgi:transposase-like protein
MLGRQFPAVETTLRDAEPELLAFAAFPVGHWKKIWSTDEIRNPSAWRGFLLSWAHSSASCAAA